MEKRTKVMLAALGGLGCLGIMSGVALFLLTGVLFSTSDLMATAPEVESHTPDTEQVEHCRQAMQIKEGVEIEMEWYYFQPGFQDDRLQCWFTVEADSATEIFKENVDPHDTKGQTISPGRSLTISVEERDNGIFYIQGSWFEF